MSSTWEHQLAWMAGFVDGEGCIHISRCVNRRGGNEWTSYQLILHVSQSTRPALARFAEAFGGTPGIEYRKGKPYWYWRVSGSVASETLKQLLPYLLVKKAEAENAIAFQETLEAARKVVTRGKKGSGYTVETKQQLHGFHTAAKALNSPEQVH